MANALFTEGKENLLGAVFDLDTDTMKVALTDEGSITVDPSTHDFYNDIESGTVGTPGTLDSKTISNGTFDAADEAFTALSGSSVESLNIYEDTAGASSTDPLLVHIDTGTNIPFTPNGGDVTIQWNGSGIFSI